MSADVHLAAHLRGRALRGALGGLRLVRCGGAGRQLGDEVRAGGASGLDGEVVAAVLEHLGEREVEAVAGPGAGAHRDAEACPARLATVDGDDEVLASLAEHAVEDPHRVQLARARAEERVPGSLARLGDLCQAAVLAEAGAEQPHLRRKLKALPRVRADGIAEQRLVVAAGEPVVPAVLLVGPPHRQVGGGPQLAVDDRAVGDGRADHGVPASRERSEELVEALALEDVNSAHVTAGTGTKTRCASSTSRLE